MKNNVRNRLQNMIEVYGTTQAFIGKNIGCSKNFINMFLKEKRNLSEKKKKKLDEFLKERNC